MEQPSRRRLVREIQDRQNSREPSARRRLTVVGTKAAAKPTKPKPRAKTDMGNAERFVEAYRGKAVFIYQMRAWMFWNGKVWAEDTTGQVRRWAMEVVKAIRAEAENYAPDSDEHKQMVAWARASQSARALAAMLDVAKDFTGMTAQLQDFDQDTFLLNCANGMVDLRTGDLRPHDSVVMCSKIVPYSYNPAAQAPAWAQYLKEVQPRPEMRGFLRRAVGYSLTGETSEQKLLVLTGTGSNGKSVFVRALEHLAGGYSERLGSNAFVQRSVDRVPVEIAKLTGARLVAASEFAENALLDEQTVKELTGGESMTARFMRQNEFKFTPQCTIWISSNHKPTIRGTDYGIWRRFLIVEFGVRVEKPNKRIVEEKFLPEMEGILAWAVKGAMQWFDGGLRPPQSVVDALESYRKESDWIGQFLEEHFVLDPEGEISFAEMYQEYSAWTESQGMKKTLTKILLGKKLKERGIPFKTTNSKQRWIGYSRPTGRPKVMRG